MTLDPASPPPDSRAACPADQGLFVENTPRMESTVDAVRKVARGFFEQAKGSHDWDHTQRVYHLCERLGPPEGADMEVLRIAALLHDIGRSFQDESGGMVCHAEKGADMALGLLQPFDLSEPKVQNILHCISTHRFRGDNPPETLEARVLFDADKIDAIGAVGVARAYLFAGEIGAKLHNPEADIETTLPYTAEDTGYREFRVKLSKIKNRMLTREGKSLAGKRHDFMTAFFDRLVKEVEGKDP